MTERVKAMLIRHEGMRLKPYRDTAGKLTIGVGRNLDDVGISESEAYAMLDVDVGKAFWACHDFPWWSKLDPVRQDVLAMMVFNMGIAKVKKFYGMLAALEKGDYAKASDEMLHSLWASQVGRRAIDLAQIMNSGRYPG